MPKLRVVIVCPGGLRNKGGIGRAVGYITEAWRTQPDAPEYRIVDPRGPGRLLWSPFYLLWAVAAVVREFTGTRADLLHINISHNGSTLRKLVIVCVAVILRAPYILHLHGSDYHLFFRKLWRPLQVVVRAMFRRANRVIVLGAGWRDFVCDEIGVDRERVVIMHNSVPVPATIRREPSPGPCRILFLGRLGARKGVPELLQALATDRVRSLEWIAVVAGDGAIENYRKMLVDLNLKERVELPGWVGPDTVSAYLGDADILALPSHNEGLPMSVLEAMAHGLAIVTTPVGAISEAIDDGVSGLLVPPGDVDALADALARIIEDASLRQSLSRAAINSFSERFDVRNLSRRLTEIYRESIAINMASQLDEKKRP